MTTVHELLSRAAGAREDGIRFVDRRERTTWHAWPEIRDRARRVAGGLREAGLARGERVALIHPTGIEFVESLFGILLAGGVPVPLYPPVRLGRLDEYDESTARMLRAASVRLVLADRRVLRVLGGVLARVTPSLGAGTVADLPSAPPFEIDSVDPDDLALVQFSSGSTRHPEAVALSHRAVAAQARILNGFWPDTRRVRHTGLSWLPLYHDMGLIGCVFPALERRSTLTLLGPELFVARPSTWLRALSRHRATISPAPNFAFALAATRIRDEEMEGVDLSHWRVAPNGAEPISADVIRSFESRFARWGLRPETITPVYGLSEAALAVTFSEVDRPFRTRRFDRDALARDGRALESPDGAELVSVGRPIPGFEVRIVDGKGGIAREGRVGTIHARGPSMLSGYLRDDGRLEDPRRDGWLDTGDLGFLHEGELHISGRAKDLVILRGRNYDPAVFEDVAGHVPGVRAGRVVAVGRRPEGADGEELWLFVETRRGTARATRAAVPERCRTAVLERTGVLPARIVLLDPGALPRTSSGKIRRRETERRHEEGRLTAPGLASHVRLARAWAGSLVSRKPGPREPSDG